MSVPPVRGCAASARSSGAVSTAPDKRGYANTTRCVSACAVFVVSTNGTPMLRSPCARPSQAESVSVSRMARRFVPPEL